MRGEQRDMKRALASPDLGHDRILDVDIDQGQVVPAVAEYLSHQTPH